MFRYRNSLKPVLWIIALGTLAGCRTEDPPNVAATDSPESCAGWPGMPGCSSQREPQPGFAKFTAGRADALRWVGQHGCKMIDIRTGRQDGSDLVKAVGNVRFSCDSASPHFSFVFLQHGDRSGADARTSAFLPHNLDAARRLVDSCTADSRPSPSSAVGSWWNAKGTYAEGLLQDYMAPLVYATQLMPFDADGFERLEDAEVDGVPVARFRNERATVWMDKSHRDRPLRVTSDKGLDIVLSEWDKAFKAEVPSGLRDLTELCTVYSRTARSQSGRQHPVSN